MQTISCKVQSSSYDASAHSHADVVIISLASSLHHRRCNVEALFAASAPGSLQPACRSCVCREAAKKPQGAILLAVLRGRSSEGVDFLDACARAVLVVGIPYPPLYDVTVRLKRAFNHEHEALLGSGDDWYAAEAFRAVNQAVGRLQRFFTASPGV